MAGIMLASNGVEKDSEVQQLTNEWRAFSKTLAYKRFMEHIQLLKETNSIMASGPIEIYRDVPIYDGKSDLKLDFEPEKYAYLLQRNVGCDIVKMYVEDFTTDPQTSQITTK